MTVRITPGSEVATSPVMSTEASVTAISARPPVLAAVVVSGTTFDLTRAKPSVRSWKKTDSGVPVAGTLSVRVSSTALYGKVALGRVPYT